MKMGPDTHVECAVGSIRLINQKSSAASYISILDTDRVPAVPAEIKVQAQHKTAIKDQKRYQNSQIRSNPVDRNDQNAVEHTDK